MHKLRARTDGCPWLQGGNWGHICYLDLCRKVGTHLTVECHGEPTWERVKGEWVAEAPQSTGIREDLGKPLTALCYMDFKWAVTSTGRKAWDSSVEQVRLGEVEISST